MKKVILEYDENTGNLSDKNGIFIASTFGVEGFDGGSGMHVDVLCKLKNAGFTAEEIIEFKRKEVIS